MYDKHQSVVVGIDGSQTAIWAAQWAIDEAVSRAAPLRLVYVTKAAHPSADDYYLDVHRAEASLREAQAAVEAAGKPVKVETAILSGPPGVMLVGESREADMICVGSVGIGRYARALLGSTATELAEKAHCPVAIIRLQEDRTPEDVNWIVVVMDDSPDNETIVEHAIAEAKLRDAPVLALGARPEDLADGSHDELHRRLQQWRQRYPDVHIYPVADRADIVHFLESNEDRVQLAVIGASEADQLPRIVGPSGHSVFHHANTSVLVVRR